MAKAKTTKNGKKGKEETKSEVATTGESGLSADLMKKYRGMGGAGIEKAKTEDFKIPMVYICQSNSGAFDDENDLHIKGIKRGDLYDTVSRIILSDQLRIVPCYFDVKAIEWAPGGGGLEGIHDRSRLQDKDVVMKPNDSGKLKPSVNGNWLVETAEWVCLAEVSPGVWKQFIIPMSSSGLRASSTMNTMIAEYRPDWWEGSDIPPSFLNTYILGTVRKEKDGNAYHTYTVVAGEPTPVEVLGRAETLYALAASDALEGEGRDESEGRAGPGSSSGEGSIPADGDVL